ncbi:MAG: hypothetical protein U0263_07770 [Polyangiaceae bacterium]
MSILRVMSSRTLAALTVALGATAGCTASVSENETTASSSEAMMAPWMPNVRDNTDLRRYLPSENYTADHPYVSYFYRRNGTFSNYFRFYWDASGAGGFWDVYNAYQRLPGNPPGKLLIWEKHGADGCVNDYGMLFVYANQKKVVEVGDWMTYPKTSCEPGATWKAISYKDHYTGQNSGLMWSDGIDGNDLGEWQTLDTYVNGVYYNVYYSEVPLRKKFTAASPFRPDHPWGGQYNDAVRIVLHHGGYGPSPACWSYRDFSHLIDDGSGYSYGSEYDHVTGYDSYFVGYVFAAGMGPVEEALISDENGNVFGHACSGAAMLNSQWPGVTDYRQLVTHRY